MYDTRTLSLRWAHYAVTLERREHYRWRKVARYHCVTGKLIGLGFGLLRGVRCQSALRLARDGRGGDDCVDSDGGGDEGESLGHKNVSQSIMSWLAVANVEGTISSQLVMSWEGAFTIISISILASHNYSFRFSLFV